MRCKIFLALGLLLILAGQAPAAPSRPSAPGRPAVSFGVMPHDAVNIEWWYVNAHVTTEKKRHLALIGSFFRFGNGHSVIDGVTPQPRAHYLIYAVTDLDQKTQRAYSLADASLIQQLKLLTALMPPTDANRASAQALVKALGENKLPPPHQKITGDVQVVGKPFSLAYGMENTLRATDTANLSYALSLNGGKDKIQLTWTAQKPPMAVGGKGETGLQTPTDMYYYSLTRCRVAGTIDTGSGPERIQTGQGWFDHQWGNSWVAQNNGWDWWGVQLADGTDILFFRQRDLATGRIFFPLATFMDKNGHQSVTKKIVFTSDAQALWKSVVSGVTYPLGWTVTFPEKHLTLHITTPVKNQEIPILGPGGAIWEGACTVDAHSTLPGTHAPTPGVAYMELVGYNSPAVKALLTKHRNTH